MRQTYSWVSEKIRKLIAIEISLLRKAIEKIKLKIKYFENRYGEIDNRELLYGKIDDMELIEWEGEAETLQRLEQKLKPLEEIVFEYK